MNTYDGLVNDYLRAVERALDGVPTSRRDELLSDLSEHIAARLADARRAGPAGAHAEESEVRSVLDLLGDPADVATELETADRERTVAAPMEINPGRKAGAIIWVLITIATVSLLCVGVVLAAVLLFFTSRT